MKQKLKSLFILTVVCCLPCAGVHAQSSEEAQSRRDGLHIGSKTTDRVALHNATPVAQRASAAQAAVGAQTGYLRAADVKPVFFTGHDGAGNVSVTGLAASDTIKRVVNLSDLADATADFDTTGAGVIHQSSASDYSTKKFIAFLTAANNTTDLAALKTLLNELRAADVEKGIIKGGP